MGKGRKQKSSARGRKIRKASRHSQDRSESTTTVHVDHLRGMRQWIESLSFCELVNALEVEFDGLTSAGGSGEKLLQNDTPDFALLTEMITMQQNLIRNHTVEYSRLRPTDSNLLFRWLDPSETKRERVSVKETEIEPDTMAVSELPAELMSILSQAGVSRSTSELLSTYNQVDEKDTSWNERTQDIVNRTSHSDDIKPSPCGGCKYNIDSHTGSEVGGIAMDLITCERLVDADQALIDWTTFEVDRLFPDAEAENHNLNSLKLILKLPRDHADADHKQRKKLLLRTLMIVSRGRFLSEYPSSQSHLAPWFDPTGVWFSLAVYLASRFEANLWNSYMTHRLPKKKRPCKSIVNAVCQQPSDAVGRIIAYSVIEYVKALITNDAGKTDLSSIEDIIHKCETCKLVALLEDRRDLSNLRFAEYNVIDFNTSQSSITSAVASNLQEGLAREAERSLLQSISEEKARVDKERQVQSSRYEKRQHTQELMKHRLDKLDEVDDDSSDDDSQCHVEDILPAAATTFGVTTCSTASSDNENNDSKMAVLQVIDDILSVVFQRNSLTSDIDLSPSNNRLESTNSNLSIGKTPSADDIEVSPNESGKGGAPNAAMTFIRREARRRSSDSADQTRTNPLKRSKSSGDNSRHCFRPPLSMSTPSKESYRLGREYEKFQDQPEDPTHRVKRNGDIDCYDGATQSMQGGPSEYRGDVYIASPTAASVASSSEDAGLELSKDIIDPPKTLAKRPSPSQSHHISHSQTLNRANLEATLTSRTLAPSMSREDLCSVDVHQLQPRRSRDDHHTVGHRQVDALLSYRNVVAQSRKAPSLKSFDSGKHGLRDDPPNHTGTARSIKTTRSMRLSGRHFPSLSSSVTSMKSQREPIINKVLHLDVACAKSEGGLDGGAEDASHCNVIPRVQTDEMTKDGATTISTVHFPRREAEEHEFGTLKEERDSYRDMCLNLGAENAKLRNLLASRTCVPLHYPTEPASPFFHFNEQPQFTYNYPTAQNHQLSTQSIYAMSDNWTDHDSAVLSEDDGHPSVIAFGESHNNATMGGWYPRGDSSYGRRTSVTESDTSVEHLGQQSYQFSGRNLDSFLGPIGSHNGMQSRLTKDINRYISSLKTQLKKSEHRRLQAIQGVTRIIKAIWPRADVKMYGSHVTKLCLPSSDMDFVISLPAVQKKAPAGAAGDLEGRNAIIETNQKLLSRKLKGESWLDQRSIKVIERTAVPVIKVSTKDTRSRAIQLDLSFDAKEHHGLEALTMIQHILDELPVIRPIVLVLKQFLLDRGLLIAYTGGMSSYCLFLMVAR